MRTISLLLCSGLAMLAQNAAGVFQKAPPAQDEALRKNVTSFYQGHVDGKTRQLMTMVAEDSADAFFDMQKPRLLSYEIQQITYGKEFKDAKVMILAEREISTTFAGTTVMKLPMESSWKQVDGQWRWYLPKQDCHSTPFGCVSSDGTRADSRKVEEIKAALAAAQSGQFEGEIGFDKKLLEMTTGSEVELTFTNGMQGQVETRFLQPFDDPEIELINAEQKYKQNTKGKVTVRVKAGVKVTKAREVIIPLYVEPFHKPAGLRVLLHP